MQNTAVKAREEYERKLAILIAEPKELYAVDNIEILSIDAILQDVNTGRVMIHNLEFGEMSFEFDFVGSLNECNNYIDELGSNEITIEELLKHTTQEMKELLLKRAKQHQKKGKDYKAYVSYEKDNYTSRVNATDLLSLESGLLENLQMVQESLSNQWSADSKRTVREVLEDGE